MGENVIFNDFLRLGEVCFRIFNFVLCLRCIRHWMPPRRGLHNYNALAGLRVPPELRPWPSSATGLQGLKGTSKNSRLIAVAIPLIVARPDCYANRPNTATPTSSAPAGIALQIPATAAITTTRRVIIMCSYHYETLRGQPREVANCSDWVRDLQTYMGR